MRRWTTALARLGLMCVTLAAGVLVACGGQSTTATTAAKATSAAGAATSKSSPAASGTTGKDNKVTSSSQKQWSSPPKMQLDESKTYTATLHTTKGDVVIDLFAKEDPITVNNFVFLAQQGFYNNVPFHRVIKGFMIQTGDPTGTGAGGPGYKFQDEPVTRDYKPGVVAMANAGPNTNGSQFFIMQGDYSGRLPKNYTIFGQVTQGMDVVNAIANVPVGPSQSGEMSAPQEQVSITSVDVNAK